MHEGRASLTTAMINSCAYAVLMASEYRPTAWFGGLLALTMAVAFLAEVFILPATIKLLPSLFSAERLRAQRRRRAAASPRCDHRALRRFGLFDRLMPLMRRRRASGAGSSAISSTGTSRSAPTIFRTLATRRSCARGCSSSVSWMRGRRAVLVFRLGGRPVADRADSFRRRFGERLAIEHRARCGGAAARGVCRSAGRSVDLRAGLSNVVWGRLDEVQPSDVINPLDVSTLSVRGTQRSAAAGAARPRALGRAARR